MSGNYPLNVSYDPIQDIVSVNEKKFSGTLFRELDFVTPPGYWLRVTKVEDGLVTCLRVSEEAIKAGKETSL